VEIVHFQLKSWHGALLGVDDHGRVGSYVTNPLLSRMSPLIALRTHPLADWCLLFAPHNRGPVVQIMPDRGTGPVAAARIARSPEGSTSLYSPITSRFMIVLPPEGLCGRVEFSVSYPQDYERLTFEPLVANGWHNRWTVLTAWASRIGGPSIDPAALARIIVSEEVGADAAPFIDAVVSLLTPGQIEQLASAMLAAGSTSLGSLRRIYPADISANFALPEIMAWLTRRNAETPAEPDLPASAHSAGLWGRLHALRQSRSSPAPMHSPPPASHAGAHPPAVRHLGHDLDRLAEEGTGRSFVSAPFEINVALRGAVAPRQRACLLATARNEGLYLLEWIAYHRKIGFEQIFIYSNNNSDRSDDLLLALAEAGEITWIENAVANGTRAQWKAYGHALRVIPETLDYAWCLTLDLDEFFLPGPGVFDSVGSFLSWHEAQPVDAIAINWVMVGSNGQTHWRDDLMLRRFARVSPHPDAHVKTMFRTREFIHSFPHEAIRHRRRDYVFRAANGDLYEYDKASGRAISSRPDMRFAAIVHYFFKSNQEFLWKAARNRGDDALGPQLDLAGLKSNFIRGFVQMSQHEEWLSPMLPYAPQVDLEVARLRRNPRIREAEAQVRLHFHASITGIIAAAQQHPEFLQAAEWGKQLIDPLLSDQ
jgi:hypothetical protein